MIFQHTWQQVMDGSKTMTRRIVKPGEWSEGEAEEEWHVYTATNRPKWEVGRTYSVQPGRGKPAIGRIRVIAIRRERVQDMSLKDCAAELGMYRDAYGGMTGLYSEFMFLWQEVHGASSWDDNPDVWVLEFQRVED